MPAQASSGAGRSPIGGGANGSSAEEQTGERAPSLNPSPGKLEAGQVRAMFERIARVYDLLNTVMTAGLDRKWRIRAVDLAGVGPGDRVLDVATGTGELALELARRVSPGGEVIGSDFSEAMLARARVKPRLAGTAAELRFEWGDALALPYEDDSFDAATVGFGLRNFTEIDRGLAEMRRVVRPGGRVVILEFTNPTRPPLSFFYRVWFDRIVPILGHLSGDPDAYSYLPDSVKRFPPPAGLAAELERVGLREISYLLTAGGILVIHVGMVPAEGA
jgi:demethylmenaquinone methyltransferase/2-methoxy-6-polyprenyl-1,4-benzoquinol methylase